MTEWIGIHAIFGAFLLGVIIPHDAKIARELAQKLEDIVVILLLIIAVASAGKSAAVPWRRASPGYRGANRRRWGS